MSGDWRMVTLQRFTNGLEWELNDRPEALEEAAPGFSIGDPLPAVRRDLPVVLRCGVGDAGLPPGTAGHPSSDQLLDESLLLK
jgi:hypothetical protein